MNNHSDDQWTKDEQQSLRHEAFVAEILRRRDAARNELEPGTVLRLLQSPGGTAVITILLGSLLAPIVISYIQSNASRNEQALNEYKQYLERQQASVNETYDLIGRTIFATGDLISVTKPTFNPPAGAKVDRVALDKQIRDMIANNNATIKEWRVKENVQGLIISYYFYGDRGVTTSWTNVQGAVNAYIDCANERHENFLKYPDIVVRQPDSCSPLKSDIRPMLAALSESIEVSRRYTWQQYEVPTPVQTPQMRSAQSPSKPTPKPTQ